MPRPASPLRSARSGYLAAPPLLRESEPFEGAAVLRDHPDALGLLLWRSLRDLAAWTETAAAERGALFPPGAASAREAEIAASGAGPETWGPLLVIARLLAGDVRGEGRLVHACRALACWAEGRGTGAAQLAFTQAAARLAPDNAALAYRVGRLARDRGEHARAESWLRAAIRLARGRDWHTYALAYLSLGTLYQQLGNFPAARAVTVRGMRTARRRRLRPLQATGHHNLFVLAVESGDYAQAQVQAARAIECYGPDDPRLPMLAYDLACMWFLCGCFERTLPVLEAAVRRFPQCPERAMGLANSARAAAAVGDRERFARYWEAASAEAERYGSHPMGAEAWLNLGRAAVTVRDPDLAVAALARARSAADRLRLGQLSLEVDAVEDSARGCRTAVSPRPASRPGPLPDAGPLADRLVRTLDLAV